MKKLILLCVFSLLVNSCACAKTKVMKFNSNNINYTNEVQDIAVFQEACQNHLSGNYYSKLYDFNYTHDDTGRCIVNYGNTFATFKVELDNAGKHVVHSLRSALGGSLMYDLYLKKKGADNYYVGTLTVQQ